MKKLISNVLLLFFALSLLVLYSCKKTNNNNSSNSNDWLEVGGNSNFSNGSTIYDIVSDGANNLYVSGAMIHEIAVWNGSSWGKLGNVGASPFTGGVYWPIAIDAAGNIYATGRIDVPQANAEYHVAKWEKSSNTWVNLTAGHPICNNGVQSMVTDAAGNLYLSANNQGSWGSGVGTGNFIMKWNGSSWGLVGDTLPAGDNIKLAVDASGNLYANPKVNANYSIYVAQWTGSGWQELGGSNAAQYDIGQIMSICTDASGNVYEAGYFVRNDSTYSVIKWDKNSNTLSFLKPGINRPGFANSIVATDDGSIYAGGDFADSTGVRFVAKWNGTSWSKVGNLAPNHAIRAVCVDHNGKIYAGGDFTNASGLTYVAYHNR